MKKNNKNNIFPPKKFLHKYQQACFSKNIKLFAQMKHLENVTTYYRGIEMCEILKPL